MLLTASIIRAINHLMTEAVSTSETSVNYYYYYYLFTAIGFAPGGSGPYTTQLQQKTYNNNNKKIQ
jgi:hypothetical protein